MENQTQELEDTPTFHPVYCLRSEVDISSLALTGMKQSGLCVLKDSGFEFRSTDSYSTINDKLRAVFPKLFDWIARCEPDDSPTSSWLVCMKPPYSRRSLIVYSDDQNLPNGFDIITASQLSKSKVGLQNRVLYLVTREPIPGRILMTWRPTVVSAKGTTSTDSEHVELEDPSLDETEDEGTDHHSTDISEEVINVQTDEEWDKPTTPVIVNAPPAVDTIHDPFNSSLSFINDENPWAS